MPTGMAVRGYEIGWHRNYLKKEKMGEFKIYREVDKIIAYCYPYRQIGLFKLLFRRNFL